MGNDFINDMKIEYHEDSDDFDVFICGSTGKPSSAFIAKLSHYEVDAVRVFGSKGEDHALALELGSDGSVYASGWTDSSLFSLPAQSGVEAWALRMPFPPPNGFLPRPGQAQDITAQTRWYIWLALSLALAAAMALRNKCGRLCSSQKATSSGRHQRR